eukprot:365965-Chlamydomonas_euryale.AAC.14
MAGSGRSRASDAGCAPRPLQKRKGTSEAGWGRVLLEESHALVAWSRTPQLAGMHALRRRVLFQ